MGIVFSQVTAVRVKIVVFQCCQVEIIEERIARCIA
jgi:hypothetical protein